MNSWYALNAKTCCEAIASASLERHGVVVFLSMLREGSDSRKISSSDIALVSKVSLCESSQLRSVTYAGGVKKIVTFWSGPSMVDESIMDAMWSQFTEGVIELSEDRFSPGQIVRIQDGALCGLEAVFVRGQQGSGTSEGHFLSGSRDS